MWFRILKNTARHYTSGALRSRFQWRASVTQGTVNAPGFGRDFQPSFSLHLSHFCSRRVKLFCIHVRGEGIRLQARSRAESYCWPCHVRPHVRGWLTRGAFSYLWFLVKLVDALRIYLKSYKHKTLHLTFIIYHVIIFCTWRRLCFLWGTG